MISLYDFDKAILVVYKVCSDLFSPVSMGMSAFSTLLTTILLVVFIVREYLLFKNKLPRKHAIEYVLLILCICLFGASSDQFVYFQF